MMTSLQQLKVGCCWIPGKMPELPYLRRRFGKRHWCIRALRGFPAAIAEDQQSIL
jgi:hypothetical protein